MHNGNVGWKTWKISGTCLIFDILIHLQYSIQPYFSVSDCILLEEEMALLVLSLSNVLIHTPINGCRVLQCPNDGAEWACLHVTASCTLLEVTKLRQPTQRAADLIVLKGNRHNYVNVKLYELRSLTCSRIINNTRELSFGLFDSSFK